MDISREKIEKENIIETVNQIITDGLKDSDFDALKKISSLLKIVGAILVIGIYIMVYLAIGYIRPDLSTLEHIFPTLLFGTILGHIPYLITNSAANKIDIMIMIEKNTKKSSANLDAIVYLLSRKEANEVKSK